MNLVQSIIPLATKVNNITLIQAFARSGGTAVNRLISAHDDVISLSEIHSRTPCPTRLNTIHSQSKEWYGVEISPGNFESECRSIISHCDKHNKNLCIRDWSFGSYVPLKYNNHSPPQELVTAADLDKITKFTPLGIVRHPIDVWLSMKESAKTFHDTTLSHYLKFCQSLIAQGCEIIKYEDLCLHNSPKINELRTIVGIDPSVPIPSLITRNVTGDIDYPRFSRGVNELVLSKLPRRPSNFSEIEQIRNHTAAPEICRIFNYDFDA